MNVDVVVYVSLSLSLSVSVSVHVSVRHCITGTSRNRTLQLRHEVKKQETDSSVSVTCKTMQHWTHCSTNGNRVVLQRCCCSLPATAETYIQQCEGEHAGLQGARGMTPLSTQATGVLPWACGPSNSSAKRCQCSACRAAAECTEQTNGQQEKTCCLCAEVSSTLSL